MLLDMNLKPITHMFYHYFVFMKGKNSNYLNIDPLHLRKEKKKKDSTDDDASLLSFPPTKHNTSKYIFADVNFFPGSLQSIRKIKSHPCLVLMDEGLEVVAELKS